MNWPPHPQPADSPADIYSAKALAWLLDVTNRIVLPAIQRIEANQEKIMATLADVQAAVTAEDTVVDSAMALINGLAAQIKALAPNQAAIDALAADVSSKASALSAAVAANTPVATP